MRKVYQKIHRGGKANFSIEKTDNNERGQRQHMKRNEGMNPNNDRIQLNEEGVPEKKRKE